MIGHDEANREPAQYGNPNGLGPSTDAKVPLQRMLQSPGWLTLAA
jgi:hypothetical protein